MSLSSQKMGKTDLSSLLKVSVPLMLTGATQGLMLFIDRAFLAHHSVEALNGAAATYLMTAVFVFFGVAIAGIAEVLAGQYNGEGRKNLVARPIWQMIWFSLGLSVFYTPLGLWGGSYLLPESLVEVASGYFKIICFSAPLWSLQVVFAGFFACTGRSHWLTPIALFATILNGIFDYILIFGVGPIPSLGPTGAALATSLSQFIHVFLLLSLFLRKSDREAYGTGKPIWFPKEMLQGIKIGLPGAVSHGAEISAWALLYQIAGRASPAHLTVMSTVTSFHMLLGFLNEGLKQGVIAMASNLVGAGRFDKIKELLKSGILLQLSLGAFAFFPFVLGGDLLLNLMGEVGKDLSLRPSMRIGLAFTWLFLIFDGLVWIVNGILTSGGDTRVPMLINISCAWIFVVLPSWFFMTKNGSPPWLAIGLTCLYASISFLLHSLRYRQGKWRQKLTS